MKIGSIHYQIQQLFDKSGIFTPGTSKHEAKALAREKGIRSWKDLGGSYTIYSYNTADAYLAVWHQLGEYVHRAFGVRSIGELTPEHVKAYLVHKIEEDVAHRTFQVHIAAIMKLQKTLHMRFDHAPDLRAVTDEMAKVARVLRKDHIPRAYVDPSALIGTIAHEKYRLIARLQHEGGARMREVALIKDRQLCGHESDSLTGAVMGKVHLIHCKGGLERDILVSLGAYGELMQSMEVQGLFRVNVEVYRRSLVRAAKMSYQDYSGTHGLRWNFAQRRFLTCRDNGISKEEALKRVSHEMGHRRSSITLHYLLPTPY